MKHNHNHFCTCEHDRVKFCKHCNTVYCLDCSQEWTSDYKGYWFYTEPYTWRSDWAVPMAGNTTSVGFPQDITHTAKTTCSHSHGS